MKEVHSFFTLPRRILTGTLLALTAGSLSAIGCTGGGAETDFGDDYTIATRLEEPGLPPRDVTPFVGDDSLFVTVQYGGGCEEHVFTLRQRTEADTAFVWLHHDAHGDLCEAFITEPLVYPLDRALQAAPALVLLSPGERRFVLR